MGIQEGIGTGGTWYAGGPGRRRGRNEGAGRSGLELIDRRLGVRLGALQTITMLLLEAADWAD